MFKRLPNIVSLFSLFIMYTKLISTILIIFILQSFYCSAQSSEIQDTVLVIDSNIVESQVFINTDSGSIHGTLSIPKQFDKKTAVLIIAGSGPTDRDGNSSMLRGKNDGLKQLAHELAKAGFPSVRYDKRGIAKSVKAGRQEKDLRFDHFVQDAAQWINWIRLELGFRRVVVVGHSEGSLIGMLAAERTGAEGFVSLCGPGRGASEILKEQLDKQLTNDSLRLEVNRDLDSLRNGHLVRSFSIALALHLPSFGSTLLDQLDAT
jgi:pimeloyl-ACP methyl ester carboxylesterase